MVYEAMQGVTNPGKIYSPTAHALSGAAAGGLAALLTMPLDVAKTLLNTQEANVLLKLGQSRLVGLPSALRVVWSLAGPGGLFKGCRARVLYQMPATAISWSVYEFFKHYLSSRNRPERETKNVETYEPETLSELQQRSGGSGEVKSEGKLKWDTIMNDSGGGGIE